jgi:peptidoglycan/LPS O-acetylase OafA/YrhL
MGGFLGWGGGQLGVMLFFALSGFLMGRLYLAEPVSFSAIAEFARRRVARVMPLYLAAVLVSFLLYSALGDYWPLYPVSSGNIWQHLFFWKGTHELWTIPVEVQFYLVFPLLWLSFRRVGAFIFPFLGAFVALVAVFQFPETPVLLKYSPFFIAGIVVARLPDQSPRRGVSAVFLLALALYFLTYPQILKALGVALANGDPWRSPAHMIVVPLLLWATLHAPLAHKLLGSTTARYLGLISYSTYLLHYPILRVCMAIPSIGDSPLLLPVFVGALLSVCSLIYYLLEKPARDSINALSPFQRPKEFAPN